MKNIGEETLEITKSVLETESAQGLSDYIESLELNSEQNDGLICELMGHIATVKQETFKQGFEAGIRLVQEHLGIKPSRFDDDKLS